MAVKFSNLQYIDNNEVITDETHYEFIYHLENTILIALREQGLLNAVQFRYAEENLKQQRRDRGKKILQKEESK